MCTLLEVWQLYRSVWTEGNGRRHLCTRQDLTFYETPPSNTAAVECTSRLLRLSCNPPFSPCTSHISSYLILSLCPSSPLFQMAMLTVGLFHSFSGTHMSSQRQKGILLFSASFSPRFDTALLHVPLLICFLLSSPFAFFSCFAFTLPPGLRPNGSPSTPSPLSPPLSLYFHSAPDRQPHSSSSSLTRVIPP